MGQNDPGRIRTGFCSHEGHSVALPPEAEVSRPHSLDLFNLEMPPPQQLRRNSVWG